MLIELIGPALDSLHEPANLCREQEKHTEGTERDVIPFVTVFLCTFVFLTSLSVYIRTGYGLYPIIHMNSSQDNQIWAANLARSMKPRGVNVVEEWRRHMAHYVRLCECYWVWKWNEYQYDIYRIILRSLTICSTLFLTFQPDSIDVDGSDKPSGCLTIAFCLLSLTLRVSVAIFSVNLYFLCKELQTQIILQLHCFPFYGLPTGQDVFTLFLQAHVKLHVS